MGACVRGWVTLFVPTVNFKSLKGTATLVISMINMKELSEP